MTEGQKRARALFLEEFRLPADTLLIPCSPRLLDRSNRLPPQPVTMSLSRNHDYPEALADLTVTTVTEARA